MDVDPGEVSLSQRYLHAVIENGPSLANNDGTVPYVHQSQSPAGSCPLSSYVPT